MGEDDIAEVASLAHAAEKVDNHPALGEHAWLDLVLGGRHGFAGFVARKSGMGHIIGYAQVTKGPTSWGLEFVVHPSHRDQDMSTARALIKEALKEIESQGGGHVHLWVSKPQASVDEMIKGCGLKKGRDLLQMRRPLPIVDNTPRPKVRHFRKGDEAQWLDLNNRAFKNHPEQGNWDIETLEARQGEAWYDESGFLLLENEAGRLIASCWTKVHDDYESRIGEIYVIAVDPEIQSQGLGKKMVLAGLDWMEHNGLKSAMLYVDADNAPALKLYENLGFSLDHVDRAYVGDVPTPTNAPTP